MCRTYFINLLYLSLVTSGWFAGQGVVFAQSDTPFARIKIIPESSQPSDDPINLKGDSSFPEFGSTLPFTNRQLHVFENGQLLASFDFFAEHELRLAASKRYALMINGTGIDIIVNEKGEATNSYHELVKEIKIREYTVEAPATQWSSASPEDRFAFAPGVKVALLSTYSVTLSFVVPAMTSFDDTPVPIRYSHSITKEDPAVVRPKVSGKISFLIPDTFKSWDKTFVDLGFDGRSSSSFHHKLEKDMWLSNLAFSADSLHNGDNASCKDSLAIRISGYTYGGTLLCQDGVDLDLQYGVVSIQNEQANWSSVIGPPGNSNPGGVDFLTRSTDIISIRYLSPYNLNTFVQPVLGETVEVKIPPILLQVVTMKGARPATDVLTVAEAIGGRVNYSGPLAAVGRSIDVSVSRTSTALLKLNGTVFDVATSGLVSQPLSINVGAITDARASTKSFNIYQKRDAGESTVATGVAPGTVINVLPGTYRVDVLPNVLGMPVESKQVVIESGARPAVGIVPLPDDTLDPDLAGSFVMQKEGLGGAEFWGFERRYGSGQYRASSWDGSTTTAFQLKAIVDTTTTPKRIIVTVTSKDDPIWKPGTKRYGFYSFVGKDLLLKWGRGTEFPTNFDGAELYKRYR